MKFGERPIGGMAPFAPSTLSHFVPGLMDGPIDEKVDTYAHVILLLLKLVLI